MVISVRPVEVGYIDREDHPALRGPGCSERARQAFITGLFGGMIFGAVWGVATAYRCKYAGKELRRCVGKSIMNHGQIFALGGSIIFLIPCY